MSGTRWRTSATCCPTSSSGRCLGADYSDGRRYYWQSLYLDGLPDAAASPLSAVDVRGLGAPPRASAARRASFAGRHAPFLIGVEANWVDSGNDDVDVEWVRDWLEDRRQFADGSVSPNFPGSLADTDETVRNTFGSTYERLVASKDEYDPRTAAGRTGTSRCRGTGGGGG